MNISVLFIKMANGETLSPIEAEELRLWGNTAQANDEYIKSIQSGTGSININSITAVSGEFRYNPSGLNSFVGLSLSVVATATPTDIPFTNSYWDELRGYTANATTFKIPYDGKYQITAWGAWSTSAGGGYRQLKIRNTAGYMEEYDSRHSSVSSTLINSVRGEAAFRAGTDMSVEVTQTSGGNLSFSGRLSIRLLRNYDGDIV